MGVQVMWKPGFNVPKADSRGIAKVKRSGEADRKSGVRHSLSVLHLPRDSRRAEAVRLDLSKQKGVFRVDVDWLKNTITLEYDPDLITLQEIRTRIAGFAGRSRPR